MLKIQDNGLLLSREELDNLFFDYELHEKNSFFIIDKTTKTYQTNRHRESFIDDSNHIRKAYAEGHTIVVKNMEHYNVAIQEAAQELGEGTDVHLYLTPEGGDSFGWHNDDRNVWIKMLYGTKIFALRYRANETVMENYIKLEEGKYLYIPQGQYHKASPIGPSSLLSFGVPCSNLEDA